MGACSCEEAFLTKTAAEWEEIFTEADIWFTPVKAFTEVQADKQARAIGSFVQPGGAPVALISSRASKLLTRTQSDAISIVLRFVLECLRPALPGLGP